MSAAESGWIDRQRLLDYFLGAAKPRDQWMVGMEVERMGRDADTGEPIPYDGEGPSVRGVLEYYRKQRESAPIMEATHLVGLDGDYGSITLEPGGQVEWSSRPQRSLGRLKRDLDEHMATMAAASSALGVRWLTEAVDPVHPVDRMPWMPKARYNIMRPYLGARGRLAHRMMTQTAASSAPSTTPIPKTGGASSARPPRWRPWPRLSSRTRARSTAARAATARTGR